MPNPELNADGTPKTPAEKPLAEQIAEAISKAVEPLVQGQAALKTEFEGLKRPTPKTTEAAPTKISVFDDEDGAFNERLTPIVMQNLILQAGITKTAVREEYRELGFGDMWKQYEKEIDVAIDGAALWTQTAEGPKPLRGDPAYIRNCADMVIGRHAREGGVKFNASGKSFFIESGGGADGGGGNSAPKDGLTDKQRRVMDRMGIPADQRAKVLGKLEFVS